MKRRRKPRSEAATKRAILALLRKGKNVVDIVIDLEVVPTFVNAVLHEWINTPKGAFEALLAQERLSRTTIHVVNNSDDDRRGCEERSVLCGLARSDDDMHDSRRANCPACLAIHHAIVICNQSGASLNQRSPANLDDGWLN